MKQEREHQEIHLNIVAEGRELNKNQKNWLFKIYALFELTSYFFFCLGIMKFYIAVLRYFGLNLSISR